MHTEASLKELIDLWKFHEADFLENLKNFEDRKAAMKLICSRMAYDGDMASSGTRAALSHPFSLIIILFVGLFTFIH